jgi:hypothetical protein
MTTATHPPVPLPVGALTAEDWQPDGPLTYRIFEDEPRALEEGISVWTHGVQYQDGRVDDVPSQALCRGARHTGRKPSAGTPPASSLICL